METIKVNLKVEEGSIGAGKSARGKEVGEGRKMGSGQDKCTLQASRKYQSESHCFGQLISVDKINNKVRLSPNSMQDMF